MCQGIVSFHPIPIDQVRGHSRKPEPKQRNPKIQSEAISWLKVSILDFGIKGIDIKMVIEKVKTAFGATNPVSINYVLL